jgi:hypothetical protein
MSYNGHNPNNAYNNRFRWWYEAIADLQLANPDLTQGQIAEKLGKHQSTISCIINSDAYKMYFAIRRQEFTRIHDHKITSGLVNVAERGLNLILDVMEKKKDQLPLPLLQEVTDGALQRLGFGVQKSPAAVNVNVNDNRSVSISATPQELLEAREQIRNVEQMRLVEGPRPQLSAPNGKEEGSNLSEGSRAPSDVDDEEVIGDHPRIVAP